MATFTWKDKVKITVIEMSRADTIKCEQAFNAYLATWDGEMYALSKELEYLIIHHAPCRVEYDGKALDSGTHTLDVEGFVLSLTLPITRETLDRLPYGLEQSWFQIAGEENRLLLASFFYRRKQSMNGTNGSEPPSGSGPHSAPDGETISPATKTTGA